MMSSYVSLEDMELMCTYLQSVLKKQFFKFPTSKEYKSKIKELFDVEFDGKSTILYDQGIGEIDPKTVLVAGSEMSGSIFLSNEGFITLPLRLPGYRGQVNVIVSHYSLYCLNTYNKGNS